MNGDGTILGIDEAGRGSLLGPLVVGGMVVPARSAEALREIGARDSKRLSPARREAVYERLARAGRRLSISLPPRRIDAYVARHELNRLEAEAFARLVRAVRPDQVVVDACDPVAERFGRSVEDLAGGIAPVRAAHRADATDPVVGAASIVAKVRRDRAIRHLADRLGREIGSGYPSDRTTVDFVRGALRAGGEPPRWLRCSWKTVESVRPAAPPRPLESFSA